MFVEIHFVLRMLDKVRWKLHRGLNDGYVWRWWRLKCMNLKMWYVWAWMWKCVNSGYLPDDGPSGSAGWSWMTWVMALIMGNGIDYGTIHGTELMTSDHGIWHWSWNWKWPCQIMSMILAKDAKHDHGHDSDLSDMGHGTERFMIWSWYWSVPWAWHWY